MSFDLDTLTDSKLSFAQRCTLDHYTKQKMELSVIEQVHEIMGTKILSKFIDITKDNEEEYLAEYAKAKEKLYQSQYRTSC